MRLAKRSEIIILDSNVSIIEDGVTSWNKDDTYKVLSLVQHNVSNRKYKAIQDIPAGIDPVVDVNATTGIGTYWYDVESTNYLKAFDELGSSVCSNANEIYYKFQTSDVDTLYLGNLHALTVRVVVTDSDSGNILQDYTVDTTSREVYDWFDWTYSPVEFNNSYFVNLQMAYNTTLEVYIQNQNSTTSVGHIAFGRGINVGLTLADPAPTVSKRGITSKTRDEFGNIVTRKKARYSRITINCIIDSSSVDIVENRLEKFVDTPLIVVGDDREGGYKALLTFGELKDHSMPIGISKTQYTLEIEGYL
jgi:hypothetical protein